MYVGASPFRALNVRSSNLKSALACIGSQCNCISVGVMWSNFRFLVSTFAAAFWTSLRPFVAVAGKPEKSALQ